MCIKRQSRNFLSNKQIVNNGVLFLDNRVDYEIVEINKIILDNDDTK